MTKAKTDLLQGTLDMLILKTLVLEPMHGWGTSQRIQQISKDVLRVSQVSLYPAFHRLVRPGWIIPEWWYSANNRQAKFSTLNGAGPKPLETWALVAVPEEAVALEDFDSLVFDVQALLDRIDALEANDDVQDADIQSLRTEAAALRARVAAMEELPGIRGKLAK